MKYLFLEYPKCSTCQKARQWLLDNRIDFIDRHIVENRPSAEELTDWYHRSGLPLKHFVNSSGLLYKSMHLKDKLPTLSETDQINLLASNGMLIKRPLLIGEKVILTGFKQEEWKKIINI